MVLGRSRKAAGDEKIDRYELRGLIAFVARRVVAVTPRMSKIFTSFSRLNYTFLGDIQKNLIFAEFLIY